MSRITLLLILLSFLAPVVAKEATPMAKDPVLEEKVNAVSDELRCLVCQNQTIADSHAALAVDLKNQVREMLSAGKSEQEVIDYMVERYGDFVRYRPPMKPTHDVALVWAAVVFAGWRYIPVYQLEAQEQADCRRAIIV